MLFVSLMGGKLNTQHVEKILVMKMYLVRCVTISSEPSASTKKPDNDS